MKKLSTLAICSLIMIMSALAQNQDALPASDKPPTDSESMQVPDWAKDAIWYQIFPTRFCNGDPDNDPTIKTLDDTWPEVQLTEWNITPWTHDWYEQEPWQEKTGIQRMDSLMGLRRYGGDLQGVLNKLDYLQDLGINAIYFNPVFEGPSHHKYGTSMYHHVDNNWGPDPEEDEKIWAKEDPNDPATWKWTSADKLFLELVQECHKRNIKVIIDGVFNHVGIPFWALQDVRKKGASSQYVDWFIIESFDDPQTEDDEFEYSGYPDFVRIRGTKINDPGPAPTFKKHIRDIVKRWGDPNNDGDPSDGIDGWRLDMAHIISLEFWRDFRKWVKEVNPEAYLTGEVWWEDFPRNKMYNAAQWLQGDMFDGVMNYRFAKAVQQAFINVNYEEQSSYIKEQIRPSELLETGALGMIRAEYPEPAQYVLQNLMGSHDTERLINMVLNPNRWINHPYPLDSKNTLKTREKPSRDLREDYLEVLQQILIFQFTYIGAPYIYYGDEIGMWGPSRKPMIWPELTFEDEHPFTGEKSEISYTVERNKELLDYYKSLIQMRKNNKCLRRGKFKTVYIDDENYVFAYERSLNQKERIRVVFNTSSRQQEVNAVEAYLQPLDPEKTGERNESREWELIMGDTGDLNVLPPKAARVYKFIYQPGNESGMTMPELK